MEGILQYWEQLVFFLTALVVAVKLHTDVTTLKKDVEKLEVSLDTIQKKKILLLEGTTEGLKNNIINFHKSQPRNSLIC